MGKYICFNGEYLLNETPQIHSDNRSFTYGDGFFETIRCLNSQPLFFDKHFCRILQSVTALKMKLPTAYNQNYFKFHINKLLQKCRIYQGARVRITFFRSSGGFYMPGKEQCEFLMSAEPVSTEKFLLPDKGINIGIYKEEKKMISRFSPIKTCNALFYVMAGIWKKENNLDDCLIVNQEGRIIEGSYSNIFLVKDNRLYPTTVGCGCIDGIMRQTIIEIACSLNIEVRELEGFTEKDLLVADEVFLSNSIQGIVPVAGFKSRRYYRLVAGRLNQALNKLIAVN